MRTRFQPKRSDGRALWRVLYDYMSEQLDNGNVKVGGIFTHNDLLNLLDKSERPNYRTALNRAVQELREEHNLSLASVRGKGYRVIEGMAMGDQGAEHRQKAKRSLNRGMNIIKTVDVTKLTPGERTQIDMMQRGMTMLVYAVGASWERLNRHEKDIRILKSDSVAKDKALQDKASASEVDELRRRLDELEGSK